MYTLCNKRHLFFNACTCRLAAVIFRVENECRFTGFDVTYFDFGEPT